LRHNPVLAARHAHLTGRTDNKLSDAQARIVVAGSLLRQLHAVITTGTSWDPAIASGLHPHAPEPVQEDAAAA
jgi:transposase